MPWNDPVDPSIAVPSSLSIGYYSPGWPLAAFPNGIVTYVATLVPTLKAMGLQVTIIAGRMAEETFDGSVYNLQHVEASRNIACRAVDRLWYRIAPGRHRSTCSGAGS